MPEDKALFAFTNSCDRTKMIESAVLAQNEYFAVKPKAIRKELGQYFTGSMVADYMASLIVPVNAPVVRILDAGAGTGVLALAAALRCLELGHECVHAVLYEIDEEILSHLDLNMRRLSRTFQAQGAKFTFDIRHEDFVLARPDKAEELFHVSSINPPYFKYNSKTSPYACATTDLYKGNPNIYASFMAVVASCTAENGQMVAIVPRSFTNGLYFKGFRKYLNATMSLERIHIFRARNKVFKELSVLQENVICSYTKRRQSSKIVISASSGYEDIVQSERREYKTKLLIDCSNEHEIIRIPETAEDLQILETVEQWPSDFQNSGYTISTGRVVEHRTREYIIQPNKKAIAVPLLRMHNVKAFKTEWTGRCKKDASFLLLEGHQKHTSENIPYVILKRFSSKDEKRRLVAGVHNHKIIVGILIALENHLNYIGRVDSPIDIIECYGLAVLFNSTLMDKYFRCISGNTQVNATEIRLLKLPARKVICAMGKAVMDCSDTNQENIDQIVNDCIGVRGSMTKEEKLAQAQELLEMLGLPKQQYNNRSAWVFLALANIRPQDNWQDAQAPLLPTVDIMQFIREYYGQDYKPNSRETIRRQTLHQFEQARIVDRNRDNPSRATNSKDNNYSLNEPIIEVLREYPNGEWQAKIAEYEKELNNLQELYQRKLDKEKIPIRFANGQEIMLSPGKHNQLHADIVHEFCSRFIGNSGVVLYIGDTASSRNEGGKLMILETEQLKALGVSPMAHDKLPDVVVYDQERKWLFLIEAVTSHGAISPKRWIELEKALESCKVGRVYVTAFPDAAEFRKYAADIAWETEVWIADNPDHMIHFNGDRFLGPH